MRGDEECQEAVVFFSSCEDQVPPDHPLRSIRRLVDRALRDLDPLFEALYAERGRPSIPPELLLRASLLQKLYGIPSERKLCEHLQYNLLFRWFCGLPFPQSAPDHSTFSVNRERLLTPEVLRAFFLAIRAQAESRRLLSREHFSVDGTLIEAAASIKSFRPQGERKEKEPGTKRRQPPGPPAGRNEEVDFRGETFSNESHQSSTDPDARLAKIKGKEAKLCYRGHLLVENRHGLIVDCELTQATGTAEPEAAVELLSRERGRQGRLPLTVGADRGYNTRGFVQQARALNVTPHVARKKRYNAIDGRTTSHDGYLISQRRRKVVEEPFGWMKDIGGLRKLLHRGLMKVRAVFTLTCTAFNLRRMAKLLAEPSPRPAMQAS